MPRGSPLVTFFVVALALKKTALQIRFFSVLLERFGYTRARLGIEKLMLDALNHMSALYDRVLVACTFMCYCLKGWSLGQNKTRRIYRELACNYGTRRRSAGSRRSCVRTAASPPSRMTPGLWTSCMIS